MSLEPQDTNAQNVDEVVNIDSVQQEKVKKVEFQVHHWTELKTTPYSCGREMIFSENGENGCIKPISCNLSSTKTAAGERSQVRYIQFDESYLKYQIVALLRDLLFECLQDKHLLEENEFDRIKNLVVDAINEFQSIKNDLIDNADTSKAIKPKDVTQALKQLYKP
jgi:hypothetical protein